MNETYELTKGAFSQLMENVDYARTALQDVSNHNATDTSVHGRLMGICDACERLLMSAVMIPAVDRFYDDIEEEVIDG